jgi:hypothetical protein
MARLAAVVVAVLAVSVPGLVLLPSVIGASMRCAWEEPQPCDIVPVLLADPSTWVFLFIGLGLGLAMLAVAWTLWRAKDDAGDG